jgi:2-polyprenyl-3-methyl-5-hydroxy-6-metoxy-1,4-benzoquinol methylase
VNIFDILRNPTHSFAKQCKQRELASPLKKKFKLSAFFHAFVLKFVERKIFVKNYSFKALIRDKYRRKMKRVLIGKW